MSTGQTLLRYWPILVVAAGVVASGAVDNFRITSNAEDISTFNENLTQMLREIDRDHGQSIDENEETIEEIQKILIERQGDVKLDIQRIENDLRSQRQDIAEILRLLQMGQ